MNGHAAAERSSATTIGAWRLVFRSPTVVLAYAAPVAAGTVLALIGWVWAAPTGWIRVQNGHLGNTLATPAWWTPLWALVAVAGIAFGITAATRAALVRAYGGHEHLGATLRAVARTPVALLIAAVVPAAAIAAVAGLRAVTTAAPIIGWPLVLVAVTLLAGSLSLAVAWPPVAVGHLRLRSAVRTAAWRRDTGPGGRRSVGFRMCSLLLVAGVASWGAVMLRGWATDQPNGFDLWTGALAVIWAWTALASIGVVVTAAVDGARTPLLEATSAAPRRYRSDRARLALAGALTLAPALAVSGTTALHPSSVVDITIARTSPAYTAAQAVTVGDRVVVATAVPGMRTTVDVCTATDCAPTPSLRGFGWTVAARADGSALFAHVHAVGDDAYVLSTVVANADDLRRPAPNGALRLDQVSSTPHAVARAEPGASGPFHLDETINRSSIAVAVDAAHGLPVIAWVLNDQVFRDGADTSILRLIWCHDSSCSTSTTTSTPLDRRIGWASAVRVVRDDSTAVVSLGGNAEYADRALVVTVTELGASTKTVIAGPSVDESADLYDAPVALALGADRQPRLLYREGSGAALVYVRCDDLACTSTQRTRLPMSDAAVSPASFTIDATDRPLIPFTTSDQTAAGVLSCLDTACESTERRVLADTMPSQEVGDNFSLWPVSEITVDSAGLPVLLVNAVIPRIAGKWYDTGMLIRCNRARCGAG